MSGWWWEAENRSLIFDMNSSQTFNLKKAKLWTTKGKRKMCGRQRKNFRFIGGS